MMPLAVAGDVFAGLFARGVQDAGFSIDIDLENSTYGGKTAKLNFPYISFYTDPTTWPVKDYAEYAKQQGGVALMFCNPPCALWSTARAAQCHWTVDPRFQWHKNLRAAARVLQPKAFVLESVTQGWRKGREYFLEQAHDWQEDGYSVTIVLQNNMYIGGTQNRKRMFFVAHKHPLIYPPFTRPRTVEEIFKPLGVQKGRELRPNLKWCYERSAPGDKLRKLTINPDYKGAGISFLFNRLNPKEPPPVMISYESGIHPKQPRWLSLDEMKALSGVPDDFKFHPQGLGAIGAEMARAVHVGPGRWIATAVKNGLSKPALKMAQFSLTDFRDPDDPQTYNLWEAGKQ